MKNTSNSKRKAGRPLSFERSTALRQAMLLFWKHGYEATSIADLTHALGITAPSLYAAFGDKKHLFLETVDLYLQAPTQDESLLQSAEMPTSQEAARMILTNSVIVFTQDNHPHGCMIGTSALSVSSAAADVQARLADIRIHSEARLRDAINKDVELGILPEKTDADALAGFVIATVQGISVLARDGATRQKLLAVVDTAMKAWPNVSS